MEIRLALPSDSGNVALLGEILFGELVGVKVGDAVRDVGLTTGKLGETRTRSINAAYWLLEDEGKVIGMIGLYSPRWIGSQNLYLGWFGIHPDFRRQGLGEHLISFAVDEATKLGARSILVETSPEPETTVRFYNRVGFSEVARVSDYWEDSTELVLLRKSL